MPGHKGKPVFPEGTATETLDYTELDGTGNLYEGSPPFSELNALFARDYRAASATVLAGGSTLGVLAMISAAFKGAKNRNIICDRGAHKSVYNAIAINRLEPVYLRPSIPGIPPFCDIGADFDAEELDALLEKSGAAAVVVTSPTYYGAIRDIKKLSRTAHAHGALLLVDEAHGAHLAYLENHRSAVALGADMSVCSLHKTLRALGGAALLTASAGFEESVLRAFLSVYGSSSPSYLIVASADLARADIASRRAELARLAGHAEDIGKAVAENTPFVPFQGGYSAFDPLHLTVNTACGGLSGAEAAAMLKKSGIVCELYDAQNVVFILSLADTEKDLDDLRDELLKIGTGRAKADIPAEPEPPLPEQALPLWDAMTAKTESVPLKYARGRVSAAAINKTPPCVPLIAPGEMFTEELIFHIVRCGFPPDSEVSVVKQQS